jgi:hypothetical protein
VGSRQDEVSTTDGMNEKGLVANVLWLVESQYPKFDGSKPGSHSLKGGEGESSLRGGLAHADADLNPLIVSNL